MLSLSVFSQPLFFSEGVVVLSPLPACPAVRFQISEHSGANSRADKGILFYKKAQHVI